MENHRLRTVNILRAPLCICGAEMLLTDRETWHNGAFRKICTCPKRRWWNVFAHPEAMAVLTFGRVTEEER